MVLFTLSDVTATVTGSCSLPTLKVIGVTSNQPVNGGGSGNTTPDYTFNSTGVCLRSERCGTLDTPRVYTITFEATDGNVSVTQERRRDGRSLEHELPERRLVAHRPRRRPALQLSSRGASSS